MLSFSCVCGTFLKPLLTRELHRVLLLYHPSLLSELNWIDRIPWTWGRVIPSGALPILAIHSCIQVRSSGGLPLAPWVLLSCVFASL